MRSLYASNAGCRLNELLGHLLMHSEGVAATLCEIMAERHPDDFAAHALTVRGPRRRHIAADADGMINPVPIGATGLWQEANQSATSAQRVAELILEVFGYSGGDFYVAIQP